VFGVREHGLDHLHPFAVELPAVVCAQDGSHPGVATPDPSWSWFAASPAIGWDEHLDVFVGDHLVEVPLVPVARVGERNRRAVVLHGSQAASRDRFPVPGRLTRRYRNGERLSRNYRVVRAV
jgi:hypothetical protein